MTHVVDFEAAVARRFDDLADRFKSEVAIDDPRYRAVLDRIGPPSGLRILDLGCGKGRFARRLVEQGARVFGLDASSRMIAEANGIDRVLASASRPPFRSHSFDAIVAIESFEHIARLDRAIDECARLLARAGVLIVIDKNIFSMNLKRPWLPNAVVNAIDRRRGLAMYPAGYPASERWFNPAELDRLLARRFERTSFESLLSHDERERFPFERFPSTRLMYVWTAERPRGGGRT
jgi:ubiquinone/menaquinone biosynthesis C-methylase UbiE